MVSYTVKYRLKGQWFFRQVSNVKADFIPGPKEMPYPVRILILNNESRIEIPLPDTVFIFDSNRFLNIKQQMEREAGQKIPIA